MRLHNISPANYCIAPEQMLLRRCRFASAFAFRTCRAFHAGPVVIEKTVILRFFFLGLLHVNFFTFVA